MSRWGKSLLVSLPLALALTAAFRFIQHTDREYGFWVATFGEMAAQLEARCAASRSPDVCARASDRKTFADSLRAHHAAVMAWWWPVLLPLVMAWGAAAVAVIALVRAMRRRTIARDRPHGTPGD